MTVLQYKGYQGAVEYEEGILVIRILHITDHLVAECRDSTKVQSEFESLVDEYIDDCAAIGKEPEKPFKGLFNVRVAPELHRQCVKVATWQNITLNEFVVHALQAATQASQLVRTEMWAQHVHVEAHYKPIGVSSRVIGTIRQASDSAIDAWSNVDSSETQH